MKYDVAMHLLTNEMIKKENYELVSKILSGIRIPHDELEAELECSKNSTYDFSGVLGKSNCNGDLEIRNGKDKLGLLYETRGLRFEMFQDRQNKTSLHVRKEDYANYYRGDISGYYMVDKNEDEDYIIVRYYDKEACDFIRRLDVNIDFLEVENFEQAGLLPDEEVVLENVDVIDLAQRLIAPYTTGKGNFEEEINKILYSNKEKVLNK